MIAGIGVDIVEIARFNTWHRYADKRLLRIFTEHEIAYCRAIECKTAERLAVRFAAKEAFYKAFSQARPQHGLPFLTLCKALEVRNASSGAPSLQVAWDLLGYPALITHISLSHSSTQAVAMVILEEYAATR